MNEGISIFWNHIGREHGITEYAQTIKKNTDAIKKQKIEMGIKRCKEVSKNRFIKHDEDTIIELAPEDAIENFIIIYCIKNGLQFSLDHKKRYNWWLVDIVEIERIENNIYCSHDLFIDISIEKDGMYRVLDMDEFHYAYINDILTPTQYNKAMASFISIIELLNHNAFPIQWLESLVEKYAASKQTT